MLHCTRSSINEKNLIASPAPTHLLLVFFWHPESPSEQSVQPYTARKSLCPTTSSTLHLIDTLSIIFVSQCQLRISLPPAAFCSSHAPVLLLTDALPSVGHILWPLRFSTVSHTTATSNMMNRI